MTDLIDNTVHIAVETMRERNQLKDELAEVRELLRTTSIRNYELKQRIAKAAAILPDVDNDIVREALWKALEGK